MLETIREFASEQLEDIGRNRRGPEAARRADDRDRGGGACQRGGRRAIRLARGAGGAGRPPSSPRLGGRRRFVLGLELACAYENFWGPHAPRKAHAASETSSRARDGVPPRLRARALRNIAGAAHQERDFDVAEPALRREPPHLHRARRRPRGGSVRMRLAYCAFSHGRFDSPGVARRSPPGRGRFPFLDVQGAILLTTLRCWRAGSTRQSPRPAREVGGRAGWKWAERSWHVLRLAVASSSAISKKRSATDGRPCDQRRGKACASD